MTPLLLTYLTPLLSTLVAIFHPFMDFVQDHPIFNDWLKYLSVGAFLEMCRGWIPVLVKWISQSVVATARISEDDESYDWIYNYLSTFKADNLQDEEDEEKYSFLRTVVRSLPFSNRSTLIDVTISTKKPRNWRYYLKGHYVEDYHEARNGHYGDNQGDRNHKKVRVDMVPSIGAWQKFNFKGKTIRIGMVQDDDALRGGKKWIIMKAYFATPRMFTSLLTESHDRFKTLTANKTSIFTPNLSHGATWQRTSSRPNRPWESIFLDSNIKDWILNDCQEFLKESEFYLRRGIPYRRGYLCFGVAGSGKSSMIGALAAELNLDIYLVNLGGKSLDDDKLQELLQACPGKCLLLMEDIDCAFTTKKPQDEEEVYRPQHANSSALDNAIKNGQLPKSARQSKEGITLSGLLNALDGVASGEGRLLFCTTNWKDRIDPALSRPGRCDIWIEFKHATKSQAKSLFEYFYRSDPESKDTDNEDEKPTMNIASLAEEFSSHIPGDVISVSALQGYLMRYKRQPELAVQSVRSWVENGCGQGPTPLLHDGKVDLRVIGNTVETDTEKVEVKVNRVKVNGHMEEEKGGELVHGP
ncbi:uncharacterized protein L199_006814 [Kwoniella botswanensis]|uniref:uncharacterized protein n=1 Tax=Kwoniella botswanensis TaxID=1268659 RepID=UPI00315D4B8C